MEMADRDLTVDMESKLNKYEMVGELGPNYCKYMYLIRATNPISGNTILHYICNRRSVEMFQLVFPYYLVLYNEKFPELLTYYINKKNKMHQTPLDLLANVKGNPSSSPIDYKERWIQGTLGTVNNAVSKLINLKKLSVTLIRRAGNIGGRSGFIEKILRKFGGKKSSDLADVEVLSGPQNAIPMPYEEVQENSFNNGESLPIAKVLSKNDVLVKPTLNNQPATHYSPGTQENYSKVPSRNLMMKKGTESEFPRMAGKRQGELGGPLNHALRMDENDQKPARRQTIPGSNVPARIRLTISKPLNNTRRMSISGGASPSLDRRNSTMTELSTGNPGKL
jgi:hypothetical protein